MTRTLTAMFDNRSDAEAAQQRLRSASIRLSDVQVHDQSSAGSTSSGGYSTQQDPGFWAGIKDAFLPNEDRHTYEEGIRRGGTLLTAQVDEQDADEAVQILDDANCVDIDQRTSEWRSSGWDYQAGQAGATAGGGSAFGFDGDREQAPNNIAGDRERAPTNLAGDRDRTSTNDEERIPIVEEQLQVGKREVNRGGVRVRSYVVETPVHEQVSLRDEHVSVERRPVEEAISAAGDAFQERTIEMTETGEEAVVNKEARVREELVVRKDVNERVENVEDTVRRTEVEVDGDKQRPPVIDRN